MAEELRRSGRGIPSTKGSVLTSNTQVAFTGEPLQEQIQAKLGTLRFDF